MATARELQVGRLMADPAAGFGGAARIRIADGRIAAVEPLGGEADDPGAGLVALPAPANAHDHGRGLRPLAFDDDEDLLREARLAWRLTRGLADAEGLSATGLFEALCRNGRRSIVGEDGGGVIAPGAPADILVLDAAAMLPDACGREVEVMDLLLTRMTKRHVSTLMVAGREIVRDARCVSVDLPALEAELHAQARAAAATAPVDRAYLARLQAAVADFYRAGGHKAGPRA